MMKKTFTGLVMAALLAASSVVRADTVDVKLDGLGFNTLVGVNWTGGNTWTNEYATFVNATITNPTGTLAPNLFDPPTDFDLFCVQLLQNINIGSTHTFNFGTLQATGVPDGPPGALSANQRNQIRNMYGNASGSQYTNATNAAGFQLAIWDITFDGNTGLGANTGLFRVNPSTDAAILASMASYLVDANVVNADLNVFGLQNARVQDFLVDFPGGGGSGNDVPLPGSLSLLGLGLVGLAGSRKFTKVS